MAKILQEIQCTEQSMQPYLGPAPKRKPGRPRKHPPGAAWLEELQVLGRKPTIILDGGKPVTGLVRCYWCDSLFPPEAFNHIAVARNTHSRIFQAHCCHHCCRAVEDGIEIFMRERLNRILGERIHDRQSRMLCAPAPAVQVDLAAECGLSGPPNPGVVAEQKRLNRSKAMKRVWRTRRRSAKLAQKALKRPVGRPRKAV
jgi:hypothetical protein